MTASLSLLVVPAGAAWAAEGDATASSGATEASAPVTIEESADVQTDGQTEVAPAEANGGAANGDTGRTAPAADAPTAEVPAATDAAAGEPDPAEPAATEPAAAESEVVDPEPADVQPTPTLDQIAAQNRDGSVVSSGTYAVRNRGKALDVSGGSGNNGANVQLWDQNGSAAQAWQVKVDADGYVTLTNVRSGKALDVSGASARNGANVQQYSGNGTAAQRWAAERVDGGIRLRSALGYDLVLDVYAGSTANGANVQLWGANGTAAQVWEFVRLALSDYAAANRGGALLAPGSYVVQSGSSGAVLDVSSGSRANGANVQVWAANGSKAQVWRVSVDEGGYVTLVNAGSGKALDIVSGGARRSQNVDQYASNGTGAQRWVVERAQDGSLVLHSALDYGLVLDVSGGSTKNGANVGIYTANGTKAQSWNFWQANPVVAAGGRSVDDGVYVLRSASGQVLDVSSGSLADGATVQTWQANASGAQAWRVTLSADGFYAIRNAQSGRRLDVRGRVVIPGGSLQQWGIDGQEWNIVADPAGSGAYRIVSRTTGLALRASADGHALVTAKVDEGDGLQLFWLDVAPVPVLADGWKKVAAFGGKKVLDVANGSASAGAAVQTYASNDTRAQRWWTRGGEDGTYTLQASNSGLYLVDDGGFHMAAKGAAGNRWSLEFGQTGGYALRNVASGRALDLGGVTAWLFSTARSGVVAGFYEIASALDPSLRLDVSGASKSAGANVQTYASNGTLAQRYWIRSVADDVFTITNCNSDLNLDVTNLGTADGTNVQQYSRNNSNAQRFRFTMGESGLEIRSVLGNVVLDVYGASKANGANVDVWEANGSAAQAWVLKPAATPAKMGWQNPSWMYQVSHFSVPPVCGAQGIFSYMSPSRIGIEATRDEVVNAFIRRAYDYLGTPYRWNYACAPGVGVDCVGLVMQCAYAVGMDLGSGTGAYDFNPYAHYVTGSGGWHSHDANNFWNGGKGMHVSLGSRRRGDLISWNGHIAIYIGNDKIIEAPGFGMSVRVASLWVHSTPRGVIRIFA